MDFLFPIIAVVTPLLASGLIALLGTTLGESSSSLGVGALWFSMASALGSLFTFRTLLKSPESMMGA